MEKIVTQMHISLRQDVWEHNLVENPDSFFSSVERGSRVLSLAAGIATHVTGGIPLG